MTMNKETAFAAALKLSIVDAHPIYGSTATWHGGVGGQMLTQGCSFSDTPPTEEWVTLLQDFLQDMLSDPAFKSEVLDYAEKLKLELKERARDIYGS